MDDVTRSILDALKPYHNPDHGRNRYNTPWRPNADGGTLAVDQDGAYGLGLKWYDHKDGDAGNGFTLARHLGISVGGRAMDGDTPFASLADYAHVHGVDVEVFKKAGWSETKRAGHLAFAFRTRNGMRYRYADPRTARRKYDSDKGYSACWYGLTRAVELATAETPFVICNGEASCVAAQHHGVAACCVTGGEKGTIPADLLEELRRVWSGSILVAFDCDATGRRAGVALARFLQRAGYDARAIDLGGDHGFDLADFCRLNNGTSVDALVSLRPLGEPGAVARIDPHTGEIIESRSAPPAKVITDADRVSNWRPHIISAADLAHAVFESLTWTVDGILPEGACLLAAKPKSKKSWLALAIAIAVAMAGKALGFFDVARGSVLYLDLESNQRRMQSRLRNMLTNVAWPPNLHFATEWPRGDAALAAIEAWVEMNPDTRLIVIDILARVRPMRDPKADPYEQDYTFLQAINALAERLRITIIVIHHTRKAKADDIFDEVSGTTAITGAVATIWMLSRSVDNADEQMLHLRGRDLIDEEPIAIKWDAYTCQHIYVAAGAEASSSTERRRILEVMDDDAEYSLKEIASLIQKSIKATDNLLRRLVEDNAVQRTGRGKYARIPRGIRGMRGNDGRNGNGGISQTDDGDSESISTPLSTFSTSIHVEGVENDSASGRDKTPQDEHFHEFHEVWTEGDDSPADRVIDPEGWLSTSGAETDADFTPLGGVPIDEDGE